MTERERRTRNSSCSGPWHSDTLDSSRSHGPLVSGFSEPSSGDTRTRFLISERESHRSVEVVHAAPEPIHDPVSVGALFELTPAGTEARTPGFMAELRDAIQTAITEAIPELDDAPWKRFEVRGDIESLEVLDLNGDGLGDIVSSGDRTLVILLTTRKGRVFALRIRTQDGAEADFSSAIQAILKSVELSD